MINWSPAIDIWLDGWQVGEDRFELSLHELIDWDTIPMDHAWVHRIFGDARTIPLQRDTYAALTHDSADPSWQHITGRVHRILHVTLEYGQAIDSAEPGLVPISGSAMLESVTSLRLQRDHPRRPAGFIVTITTADQNQISSDNRSSRSVIARAEVPPGLLKPRTATIREVPSKAHFCRHAPESAQLPVL